MILSNENVVIKMKPFHESVHIKIINVMQIGRNGRIHCKLPHTWNSYLTHAPKNRLLLRAHISLYCIITTCLCDSDKERGVVTKIVCIKTEQKWTAVWRKALTSIQHQRVESTTSWAIPSTLLLAMGRSRPASRGGERMSCSLFDIVPFSPCLEW